MKTFQELLNEYNERRMKDIQLPNSWDTTAARLATLEQTLNAILETLRDKDK